MGCLSSAQANPSVVTIENRQQSTASSLPQKSSEYQNHEERSYVKKEPSQEQINTDTRQQTKASNVLVLDREEEQEDERLSRSRDSIQIHNEAEENPTHDFKDSGFQNSQSEHSLPKQNSKPDVKYDKDSTEVVTVASAKKVKKDDILPEYVPPSRDAIKSEDTDSGFENPEIASVSAYSPDGNSDDDMF